MGLVRVLSAVSLTALIVGSVHVVSRDLSERLSAKPFSDSLMRAHDSFIQADALETSGFRPIQIAQALGLRSSTLPESEDLSVEGRANSSDLLGQDGLDLRNTIHDPFNLSGTGLRPQANGIADTFSPGRAQNELAKSGSKTGQTKDDAQAEQTTAEQTQRKANTSARSYRPGEKMNPRQNVAGQAVQDPVRLASVSNRPQVRQRNQDPYRAQGLRVGQFNVFPVMEQWVSYSDNIWASATDRDASGQFGTSVEVRAQSDWARHDFGVLLNAGYEHTTHPKIDDRRYGRLEVTTGLDVLSQSRFDGFFSVMKDRDSLGSREARIFGTSGDYRALTSRVDFTQDFNRLSVRLRGQFDSYDYDEIAQNADFVPVHDRDYRQWGSQLRLAYDSSGAIDPYFQVSYDYRNYIEAYDRNGLNRDDYTRQIALGANIDFNSLLSGNVTLGWRVQSPSDPRLRSIDGFTLDGTLAWRANALTTFTLLASTSFDRSLDQNTSGVRSYRAGVNVDHALRQHVLVSAGLSYERSIYEGLNYHEDKYGVNTGIEYKFNPLASISLTAEHENVLTSSVGGDYTRNSVATRMRLQR